MNAAVHYPGAAFSRHTTNLIAPEGISGVHADADDVSWLNTFRNNLLQRFVDQDGGSGRLRSCCREYEKPAGGDDGCTEGIVAGINQMNARKCLPFQVNFAIRDSGKVGCAPDFLTPWAGNESPAACCVVYHTHYMRN